MEKGGEPGEAAALRGVKYPQQGIRLGRDLNGRAPPCATSTWSCGPERWELFVDSVIHEWKRVIFRSMSNVLKKGEIELSYEK